MEWNETLQTILDYVENHLQRKQEPIDKQELSKIAGCSFDFFQKVFSYMNGVSFSEYVRCRKLTLAGYDLKSTDKRVVDVSYQYGYDSPTSFAKAFQRFHGITPKDARNQDAKLRIVPNMQVSAKQPHSWRLERKPPFRLVGKSIRVPLADGKPHAGILKFWSDCQKDGTYSLLLSLDAGSSHGLFGLFRGLDGRPDELRYSIMAKAEGELPEGYEEAVLPGAAWAVFDCVGALPQAIHSSWDYLHGEWLAGYPFEHAKCPELEWYSDGNPYAGDYLSQIWIPVTGKGTRTTQQSKEEKDGLIISD